MLPPERGGGPQGLEAFMHSLGALESGNDYNAVGPYTGSTYGRAKGRWQIMEKIYPAWAREAGVDPDDWSPTAQEKVARFKMSQYCARYGSWDLVAVAWFAGPGRADKAKKSGISAVGGLQDMLGTSVTSYVRKVTEGMNNATKAEGTTKAGRDMPTNARMTRFRNPLAMQQTKPAGIDAGAGFNSHIAPLQAAPGTVLTDIQQQTRDDQISQDTLGSILSSISQAASGAGGQVLDLKSFLGMPEREQPLVEGLPEEEPVTANSAPAPSGGEHEAPEGLEGAFGKAVAGLLAEAGGRVHIVSGRRSTAEQQRLYDLYKAGKGNLAAKPGTSKHEHGAAVDFGGDLELVAKLAPKYGLKATVKGEPWHWELA